MCATNSSACPYILPLHSAMSQTMATVFLVILMGTVVGAAAEAAVETAAIADGAAAGKTDLSASSKKRREEGSLLPGVAVLT